MACPTHRARSMRGARSCSRPRAAACPRSSSRIARRSPSSSACSAPRSSRATVPAEVAEIRLKLADTFEVHLGDLPSAIDQYEKVIEEGMGWDRAVAALERLVVHENHRERIAGLLEPVYRQQ